MAKEQKAPEIDRRLIDHKLLWGQMSKKELDEYLKKLPNVSENAEEIEINIEPRK